VRHLTSVLGLALISFAAVPGVAQADEAAAPAVLSISSEAGAAQPVELTMEALQALPSSSFTTETIWTEGPQTFRGVSLFELAAHLELGNGVLEAAAINDYTVEVPLSDAVAGGPVIAYERNGAAMTVRDKGPLWLVYPYDSNPAYKSEEIYSRSIWQLVSLKVK
jgi:hypothetical protein